jgi:hypothetical protein
MIAIELLTEAKYGRCNDPPGTRRVHGSSGEIQMLA